MQLFEQLNEENFTLFGARYYYNPTCIDAEEFYEDLKRFNYVKKMITRYNLTGEISERLLLNHIIIIFNVFGIKPGLKMLEYKVSLENWSVIKPFLIFLKAIKSDEYTDTKQDKLIVEVLRKI